MGLALVYLLLVFALVRASGNLGYSLGELAPTVSAVLGNSSQNSTVNRVDTPTISPEEDENILSVTVWFRTTVDDVEFYYTKDGSTPTLQSPSVNPSTPILINTLGWVTVKCIATKAGMLPSAAASKTYHILDRCIAPVFRPSGGTYEGSVSVTLAAAPLATICYNIDQKDDPAGDTSKDSVCIPAGRQILLNTPGAHTIRAVTTEVGKANSEESTAVFHILAQVATPVVTPLVNTFPVSAMLTISCSTPGSTIFYTLDGSEPTESSLTVENGQSIVVDNYGRYTLKAFATEPSMLASKVVVKTFVIQRRMLEPELVPAPGFFIGNVDVEFRCPEGTDDDAGAVPVPVTRPAGTVYYTIDGVTTPSEAHSKSVPCNGYITLSAPGNITVRAIVTSANHSASSVTQGMYSLRRPKYEVYPARDAIFAVQPDVEVIVVDKDLADSYYCPKRNMRGRLIVLHNPIGHFDLVPPLQGCSAGRLELPSVSGKHYQPVAGFNLTSLISRKEGVADKKRRSNLRAQALSTPEEAQDLLRRDAALNVTFALAEETARQLPLSLQKLLAAGKSSSGTGHAIQARLLDHLRDHYERVAGLGCQLVTNAGFFNTTSNTCIGDLIGGGTNYQLSPLHNVNFGLRNGSFVTGYVTPEEVQDPAEAPFDFLISGLGWLVRDGQAYVRESFSVTAGDGESMAPQTTGPQFLTVHSARTALGHDIYGNLMLLQVEGETWVRGMTLYEFADFAAELGFHNAINLDGGGSATMTQNHTLISEPSWKCPEAPYNRSSFYRCEKKVSSITCIHAMAPPFVDASVLRQYADLHSSAPTTAPSRSPTAKPTRYPTSAPTVAPSSNTSTGGAGDDTPAGVGNATASADAEMASLQRSLDFYQLSTVLLLVFLLASMVGNGFSLYSVYKSVSGRSRSSGTAESHSSSASDATRAGIQSNDSEVQMTVLGSRSAPSSAYISIDAAPPRNEQEYDVLPDPVYRPVESPASVRPTTAKPLSPVAPGLMMQHQTAPNSRTKTLQQQMSEYARMDAEGGDAPMDVHNWAPPRSGKSLSSAQITSFSAGGAQYAGAAGQQARTREEEDFYRDEDEDEEVNDRSRLLQGRDPPTPGRGAGSGRSRSAGRSDGANIGSGKKNGSGVVGASGDGRFSGENSGSDSDERGVTLMSMGSRKGLVSKTGRHKKSSKF